MLPVALRLEVGRAVAHRGGEARHLLDGPRDGHAHGTHRRIDAVGRVDGAVRDLVDLVELAVDPIHTSPDLVDHRQDLALCPAYQRGKASNGSAQPHEQVREGETDGEEEDREREPPEVPPRECGDEHSAAILVGAGR